MAELLFESMIAAYKLMWEHIGHQYAALFILGEYRGAIQGVGRDDCPTPSQARGVQAATSLQQVKYSLHALQCSIRDAVPGLLDPKHPVIDFDNNLACGNLGISGTL